MPTKSKPRRLDELAFLKKGKKRAKFLKIVDSIGILAESLKEHGIFLFSYLKPANEKTLWKKHDTFQKVPHLPARRMKPKNAYPAPKNAY